MKAKIDKFGNLYLERKGEMKAVCCPFANEQPTQCGDWCILFGNEVEITDHWSTTVILEICKKKFVFQEFTDERLVKEES